MIRSLAFTLVFAALVVRLAVADPAVQVRYETGAAVIELEGDYANQWYSVSRGDTRDGPWTSLTDSRVLCMGACTAIDAAAAAGRTYWYRFDVQLADGSFASYGPYPITISNEIARRVSVVVGPQPVRDAARVEVRLAGAAGDAPVAVRARLFDLQGRRVRTLFEGTLPRGRNVIAWDGRGDGGGSLAAGLYVLRVESPLGVATARVIRSR